MEEKALTNPKQNSIVPTGSNEMLFNVQLFEHSQRVAKLFANSTMVPDHFKNNVGNCFIALNIASRMELDPFMVMQKMYVIHGKPGIESQLIIALINRSGLFSPLQYRLEGNGADRKCTAYAKHLETGETCEQTVTWKMVQAEGWDKKKGSKWNTLPELMFRYRSAAFFARVYCPEVIMGMQTSEELQDTINAYPSPDGTYTTENVSLEERLKGVGEQKEENDLLTHEQKEEKIEEVEKDTNPWAWDKYKNLKDAGFKPFCQKNASTFGPLSDEEKAKIFEKWERVYPQEKFIFDWYPAPEEPEQTNRTELEKDEPPEDFSVECPNGKGVITDKAICDDICEYRIGCPAFDDGEESETE